MRQGFILYPFSAIVGQAKMKRALLINAVDLRIGGLLIKGERGTGKSTAARALADLLPDIEVVVDCPFSCNPSNEDEMCSRSCVSCDRRQPSGNLADVRGNWSVPWRAGPSLQDPGWHGREAPVSLYAPFVGMKTMTYIIAFSNALTLVLLKSAVNWATKLSAIFVSAGGIMQLPCCGSRLPFHR